MFKVEDSKSNAEMSDKVTLNILTKFIKPYKGDRESLPVFLTNCDNAMSLATPDQQNVLCKFISSTRRQGAASSHLIPGRR